MLDSLSGKLRNANSSWIIRAANRRIVATCDHRIGLFCTSDKVEYAEGTRRSSRVSLRGRKLKAWLRFVVALTLVSCGKSSEGSFRGGKLPARSGRAGGEGGGRCKRTSPLNCAITLRLFVRRRVGIKMRPLPRLECPRRSSRRRATGTYSLEWTQRGTKSEEEEGLLDSGQGREKERTSLGGRESSRRERGRRSH